MTQGLPTINGRYQLHERIGEGGMGIVYRATDRLTGETVALKQVHLSENLQVHDSLVPGATEDDLRLALAHEFQILAGLRHPHIISVLDYGFNEAKRPYFTMTYLSDGQNILEATQDSSFEYKIDLIQQILQALVYLHRRGVLHRDLKPDNVQVSGGSVRVLDFGLSASETVVNESVGTPLYLAPEILTGGNYSQAADLYAVGVMLYQVLTGQHPFAPLDYKFVSRVLEAEPDYALVDAKIRPFLTQLLAKQPAMRPATANATLQILAKSLSQPLPEETEAIRESYLQAAKFIGRKPEMTQLTAALDQAARGVGTSWLIGGESGVGKSRLLAELRSHALVAGFQVLVGQGSSAGSDPYELWREPLRYLLLATPEIDDLTASILLPILPDIAQLLGRPVTPAPEPLGTVAQQRLLEAMSHLFQRQTQPTLLALEDLQWATESLDLLPYLQRLLPSQTLMIVATFRDDEMPNLPMQLPDWSLISLNRLSNDEMAALSVAMLGQVGQQPDILALLQQESEGNAFFAVEVVRALAEGAGQLAQVSQMSLPTQVFTQGMQQILQRRLQKLPARYRPLLQLAAVAGRQLDLDLLASLQPDLTLSQWLAAGHETAVFTAAGNQWQFAHDKLRETLIDGLSNQERQQHHRRVANALAALYGEQPQWLSQQARHWQLADDLVQERKYTLLAAQSAQQQFAHQEAIRLLTRVIALTKEAETKALAEALLLREQSYEMLGQSDKQMADLDRLSQLPLSPELQITVLLRRTQLLEFQGEYETALALARQAIDQATKIGSEQSVAHGHSECGTALMRLGQYEMAEEHLQTARTLFEQLGDENGAAAVLTTLGTISYYRASFVQAESYFQQSLAYYQQINQAERISRLLNSLGVTLYATGQYDQAQEYYRQSLAMAEQVGTRRERISVLNNLGVVAYILGDFDQAQMYYDDCARIARETGSQRSLALALNNLGRLAFTQGAHEAAKAYLQEGYDLGLTIQDSFSVGSILNNLGHLHNLMGEYEQARQFFSEAYALSTEANHQPAIVKATLGLLWAGLQLGSWAADAVDWLLDYVAEDPEVTGSEHLLEIYLQLYNCLVLLGDARQHALLQSAHGLLQRRAARIVDPVQRHSFLENVPEHWAILAAYARLSENGD